MTFTHKLAGAPENRSLRKLQNLRESQQLRDDVEIASTFALRTLGHRT
jgi:hypothetical protein